ncbi:MAG: efflux RND transporter permease subunit [Campylobacterota bacterium]
MKKIIQFAIEKPILNHMLLLFVLVVALFSYTNIPKEIFPPSKMDSITVTGFYSGASSKLLDDIAVKEIESEITNLSQVAKVTATVKNGSFAIIAELKKGQSANVVVDDVKDIVTKIGPDLPSDMDEPLVKANELVFPLINVSLQGDSSKEQLLEVAKELKQELMGLKQLSEVVIRGDSDMEAVLTLNESKIQAYGLDTAALIDALSNLSSIFPVGQVQEYGTHYYLSTANGTLNQQSLEDTIIRVSGKTLRLKDIAQVATTLSDPDTLSRFNAKPNITISLSKGADGDAIGLVKEVKEILNRYETKYDSLHFDTYADTSIWIKNRLNNVVSNIAFGLILLFGALFYFINYRIASIVAIGIPTSFAIGLIGAFYFGFSLNMLTLLGALIALGMLVDEAIVVAENIYRHMEEGKSKKEAAITGALEMYPAVLTATATTIFAFLPILLMSGDVGKFMQVLPIMIVILLLSSLVEAFFFLPLHAKQMLKVSHNTSNVDKIWKINKAIYAKILSTMLHRRRLWLLVMVSVIGVATFVLAKSLKFEFMTPFDTTQVYISGSVGSGKTLEQTQEDVKKIEKALFKGLEFGDDIASVSSIIGLKLDGKNQPLMEEFYFQIFLNLHERAPTNIFEKYLTPLLSPAYDGENMIRHKSSFEVKNEAQAVLQGFIDRQEFDELSIFVPQTGVVKNDIEIAFADTSDKVDDAIDEVKAALSAIRGVSSVEDDRDYGNYEIKLHPTRFAQMQGVDEGYLLRILKPFYLKASYAKLFGDEGVSDIRLQGAQKDNFAQLLKLRIQLPNTKQFMQLKDLVTVEKIPTQTQMFKENGIPISSITAVLSREKTSNEVYEQLTPVLESLEGINYEIKGEQRESQKVQKEMLQAFVIATLLIFVALIWMFDSVVKSLIVLSTIPLSVLGILAGHLIMGLNISMATLIGIVGLAGVIVNDGIIMMDFIKRATNIEELKAYALLRLRPILLTSLTTFLGLSTLIFFASGQALILQPMAVALGFGILWATVLNLYLVPLVYSLIYLHRK